MLALAMLTVVTHGLDNAWTWTPSPGGVVGQTKYEVYKSIDGGATWEMVGEVPHLPNGDGLILWLYSSPHDEEYVLRVRGKTTTGSGVVIYSDYSDVSALCTVATKPGTPTLVPQAALQAGPSE
jgi:hypothetical protein